MEKAELLGRMWWLVFKNLIVLIVYVLTIDSQKINQWAQRKHDEYVTELEMLQQRYDEM